MNLEIKEKYNNFLNIIETKEKEYDYNLQQYNHNTEEKCECKLSSGYTSINSNKSDNNTKLSLLEDEYIINKNYNEYNDINTIKSEFKHIFNDSFKKNIYKENNEENNDVNYNLEEIYKKLLIKEKKIKNNKINIYEIKNYLENKNINSINNFLLILSELIENLFNESTRGWNTEHNIYILNIEKLIDNIKKIITDKNYKIKIGFLYRDFQNPKIFSETDFTKYWIGYSNELNGKQNIKFINYSIKNKILLYCFKNLVKTIKFKKKIGSTNYKFIKKTVQIQGNKNLIIDIILFIGVYD